ncbi:hypothetical protein MGN70_005834 [Eutypa lata]|nr:hypothetical protein MGN70_005834 [Eutypa lata]
MSSKSLPESPQSWEVTAAGIGIHNSTIYDGDIWQSASKIEQKQFLVLRAIWPERSLFHLIGETKMVSKTFLDKAKKFLSSLDDWLAYLDSINENVEDLFSKGFSGLGTFALVRKTQLAVREINKEDEDDRNLVSKIEFTPIANRLRSRAAIDPEGSPTEKTKKSKNMYGTPQRSLYDDYDTEKGDDIVVYTPQSGKWTKLPRAKDEQIVNTALYLLVDGFIIHHPGLTVEWSLYRKAFALFDKNNKKIFTAMVDGILRFRHGDKEVLAIIEVKPFLRDSAAGTNAKMQETAEMAAWINACPPPNLEEERKKNPKTM